MTRLPAVRPNVLLRGTAAAACCACAPAIADGYAFEAVYTADTLSNISGGIRTGTRYLDNLDLMLEIDVAEAWGFGGGTLFAHGLYNNGTTFSEDLVGDLMAVSNIDAPKALRLYEFWYELGDERWSLKTGLYDLNSEFDVNETGSLFVHSSHGIGAGIAQTGENGPGIFPVSALAMRAEVAGEGLTGRFAVLDAVPGDPGDPSSNEVRLSREEGALLVAEMELSLWESTRLWSGAWRYTAEFEQLLGGEPAADNEGWYAGFEHRFATGDTQVDWFVRYGRANDALNPFEDYAGAGVVLENLPGLRRGDRVGFAVASGGTGAAYRMLVDSAGPAAPARETTWELTYCARINEHLTLQPDLQFVKNPAGSGGLDDAWIIGLRMELTLAPSD